MTLPILIDLEVEESTQQFDIELDSNIIVQGGGTLPAYEGSYTVDPSEQTQTLETNNKRMTRDLTVNGIPSDYVGSEVERRSSSDLTASGKTVTAPAGYYAEAAPKDVADGSVSVNDKSITANPTLAVDANGLISASVSVSDTVSASVDAGYVDSAADGSVTVSGSATRQLDTQSGQTITPSESQQTACSAGKFVTEPILVAPIPAPYIIPTGTKSITANGSGIDVSAFQFADVNVPSAQPQGTIAQRYDATLVKTWKADRKVVADDHVTLPAYSTNAQTLVAATNLEIGATDPASGYCYFLAYRAVIMPIYNTDVQVQGRQEYTTMVGSFEQIYNPANTFQAINGTGKYVATAPAATGAWNNTHYRHIYWNSTTNLSIYNAGIYGATLTFASPTVATEGITPSSPTVGVRGQNTYMKADLYATITDIRYQYIIEMWRVPRPAIGLNGFFYNDIDIRLANDISGSTHTIN